VQWFANGKEVSEEEFKEHRKKDLEQRHCRQDEAQRLIAAVGDAYKTCTEFLAQHPDVHYKVGDAQAQEHALFQKLRQNLERAGRAPRCEKVREDGTVCGSPQMKGYRYCYAHERMLQTQSLTLQLPALEDANAVQMAIMRVQKALIDAEISEKTAGLLLYSLQMASSNLKHTTFGSKEQKDVVTEMPVSPTSPTSKMQVLPLISTDDTDQNTSNWQLANGTSETLPRMNADKRRSKKAAVSAQHSAVSQSKDHPQPGAPPPQQAKPGPVGGPGAVPHEHRVG
jgi:hypothetical protein